MPRRPRPGRGQVDCPAVSRGAPPRSGALDEKKGGSGSPFLPIERGRRFDRGSAGGVGGRGRVRAPLKAVGSNPRRRGASDKVDADAPSRNTLLLYAMRRSCQHILALIDQNRLMIDRHRARIPPT